MSLQTIADYLAERIGLDPTSIGQTAVTTAVARRQRAVNIDELAAYASHLKSSTTELAELTDEIAVPETWFFRGGRLFDHLARHIRDGSQGAVDIRPCRVLSVACSTGEEPYSLAMALAELNVPNHRWRIEAVDISRRSLAKARAGRYGEFSFRQTGSAMRQAYFQPCGAQWQISDAIRDSVTFRPANAVDPGFLAGEGSFDLILCRNLLIYLHPTARRRLLEHLDRLLAPQGVIATGHAEPLSLFSPDFRPVGAERRFLFQRGSLPERLELPPATVAPPSSTTNPAGAPAATKLRRRRHAVDSSAASSADPSAPSAAKSPVRPLAPGAERAPPDAAAERDPLYIARSRADAGHLDFAMRECEIRLAADGPSADLLALIGLIQQAKHDSAGSRNSFQRALYLQPDHRDALIHLLLLCEQAGDHAQASLLRARLQRLAGGGEP